MALGDNCMACVNTALTVGTALAVLGAAAVIVTSMALSFSAPTFRLRLLFLSIYVVVGTATLLLLS